MRLTLLFCAIFLCALTGCTTVARTVNGVKQPKIETEESINKWLNRHHLSGYPVLTVEPEVFWDFTEFYINRKLVFNKNGNVAELGSNQTGVACHLKTPGEIQNLRPDFPDYTEFLIQRTIHELQAPGSKEVTREEIIDTIYYNIDTLNRYVHSLTGAKANIDLLPEQDYIVIIPFSKYAGWTIQPADIKKYLRAVKANQYSAFKVYLLNLDKQMWWGEQWNKSINFQTSR